MLAYNEGPTYRVWNFTNKWKGWPTSLRDYRC